jgi:2-keto-4-pentenoate hydratase/2-oxohepta-3-ene-1,7-dioic acid hydratase in catechol pathway
MVGKFVNKNNLEDLSFIKFSLKKNNELVQSGCSSDMLWKIDELISYVSQYFTLKIGDLIFTGTPSGVSRVESGDILEGFIAKDKMFTLKVK